LARAKIFGIGFHKTGTQSLAEALTILGYNTIHGDSPHVPPYGDEGKTLTNMINNGIYKLPTIDNYDAFTDNPYFSIWKELDSNYPGSKFILTIREPSKWLESAIRYYKERRVRPMRKWMFGEHANPANSIKAQKVWLNAYNKHNAEVIRHFEKRPLDLLVINITEGDGWEKLCEFLEKEIPAKKFPFKNKFETPTSNFERVKYFLKKRFFNPLSN